MFMNGLSGSAAKTSPAASDDLSEVVVTSHMVPLPDDMPEIVVQGTRIPWYVWALLGAVAVYALTSKR
jgi:hypothetical protein